MRADTLRSRQAHQTRLLLVGTARELFVERGYARTSTSDIVAAAGTARGAFYHHFSSKEELFRAVVIAVHRDVTDEVGDGLSGLPAHEQLTQASWRFLDVARRPDVQRVLLLDGPAVLGWAAMRDLHAANGLLPIAANLNSDTRPEHIDAATRTRAFILLAAIIEAAQLIAHADDPELETLTAKHALSQLIDGMVEPKRSRHAQGVT